MCALLWGLRKATLEAREHFLGGKMTSKTYLIKRSRRNDGFYSNVILLHFRSML